jgi:7-cyano-7-deazaguanine synthase in queuosine biosynthesis
MNWNVIVRAGENDNYYPENIGEEARFFVDFYKSESPWKMREHVLDEFINNGILTPQAHDLLMLAMSVYSADRCIERKFAIDSWQREISIHIPVNSPRIWENTRKTLEKSLAFLSGDKWYLQFRESCSKIQPQTNLIEPNDICLFSGGADSLVGAIDLLSEEKNISFVGHYGGGVTHSFQEHLKSELETSYPQLSNFNFHYIEPPKIDGCNFESSTRTRSFLFLSLATAYGSTSQNGTNLFVPENGLISLNVPLTESRTGSLSTKTTHPYFIRLYNRLLENLGINVTLVTPYRFKTKGEMFSECKNQTLLENTVRHSMSCSHPEYSRWKGMNPRTHCGLCLPCIVRRAAFNKAGLTDSSYAIDVLSDPPDATRKSGSDYRAIMMGITRFKKSKLSRDLFKVKSTGPISSAEISDFINVYRRGMNELSQLLTGSSRV